MPKVVEVPEIGAVVEFPDDMDDWDIDFYIKRDILNQPVSKAGHYFSKAVQQAEAIRTSDVESLGAAKPPKQWTNVEEDEFQEWYKNWSEETGLSPDPDDPKHFYDYRAAFKNQVAPEKTESGAWKWPSTYKTEGHPELVVDGLDTRTGKPYEEKAVPLDYKRAITQMWRSAGLGIKSAAKGIEEILLHQSGEEVLEDPEKFRELYGYPPTPFDIEMIKKRREWVGENEEYVRDLFDTFKSAYPELLPGKPGVLEQVLSAPMQFAPAMSLAFVSGGASLAMTFMTLFGLSMEEYEQEVERLYGTDVANDPKVKQRLFDTAFLNALPQTAIEFSGNMLQLHGLFNMIRASRLGKMFPERLAIFTQTLVQNAAAEGLEEYLQQFPEEIAKYYAANPELPAAQISDYIIANAKEILGHAAKEGLHPMAIGAMAGAVMAGVPGLAMLGDQALDNYKIQRKDRKREAERKAFVEERILAAEEEEFLPRPLTETERETLTQIVQALPDEVVQGETFKEDFDTLVRKITTQEKKDERAEREGPLFEEEAAPFENLDEAARAGVRADEDTIETWRETHRELLDEAEFFKENSEHQKAMRSLREAQLYSKAIEASEQPERYTKMLEEDVAVEGESQADAQLRMDITGAIEDRAQPGVFSFDRKEDRDWLKSLGYTSEQIDAVSQMRFPRGLVRKTRRLTTPSEEIPGGKKVYYVGEAVVSNSYSEATKVAPPTNNIVVRPKGADKPGKYLIAQIGTAATGQEDMAAEYFDALYKDREGYTRPDDFWEVPTWIPVTVKSLPDSDMMVVRDPETTAQQIIDGGYQAVMFSAMDVNKHVIKQIAEKVGPQTRIIVGGYVDSKYFKDTPNVEFMPDLKTAVESLGETYIEGTDTKHFKGTATIPRLCMSKGCLHKCAFCTVPKDVKANSDESVDEQIETMKDLAFSLVYLDDKTFGQAENYKRLPDIAKKIREFNPKFQGFIIQTTAPQLLKLDDQFLKDAEIAFVELGVESYNDDILAKIHKPARTKTIDAAVEKLRANNIAFIPNILVGLTGKGWSETKESYQNTLDFLKRNEDIISHVNVYNLALYEGTELAEQIEEREDIDIDENRVARSYHKDKTLHEGFYRAVLNFGRRQLKKKPFEVLLRADMSVRMAPKEKAQLGLFKEKKKAERKAIEQWVQPKDDVLIDEETGKELKAIGITQEAAEAFDKAGVKVGRGRFRAGSNFLVSVTDDKRSGVIYGLARPTDTKTTRTKDFLHGKETITEYWREIGGKVFKVLNRDILPKDKKARVEMIDKIMTEFAHELEWYTRWVESMERFKSEGITAETITKYLKIQAIASAGASPAGAQVAFGKIMRDIENHGKAIGGAGHGYTQVMAEKINTVWDGKDTHVVTLQEHQKFYGVKIGAMAYAALHPAAMEHAVVVDRHMPRLWGYNVTWGGGFRVPKHVQREIVDDVVAAAKRNDVPVAAAQAALWYGTGAGHWGSATHFEEYMQLQPKRALGLAMLDLVTLEPQAISSFRGKLYFTIRGPHRPKSLTRAQEKRRQDLLERNNSFGFEGQALNEAEKAELLDLQHRFEGESPSPWSKNDVQKRMDAHTEDNPYIPLGYWYGPGVRREAFFWDKEPHLTMIYENEIYDAIEDRLGYRATAQKRALNDSDVKAGKRNASDVYMNALAGLIQRSGDFKGFALEQNGNTWIFTFGDMVVEEHAKTVDTGLSDAVTATVKLPEDLSTLAEGSSALAVNFLQYLQDQLQKYPVKIEKIEPTLARFGEVTHGSTEYGIALKLSGPITAIRAALSDVVGMRKSQSFVAIFHRTGAANGQIVRFKFKNQDLKKIQSSLRRFGIQDYNIKFVGGDWVFETFVLGTEEDSKPVIDQLMNFYDKHGVEGTVENTPVGAEFITREKNEEHNDFETHILKYYGKKKGAFVYEQGLQEGTAWAANYRLLLDTTFARAGVQVETTGEGRSLRDDFRESETPEPGADLSIAPFASPGFEKSGPARAVFIGWQERLEKPPIPLYNILGEHPRFGSTVSEGTLRELGIPIPETPPAGADLSISLKIFRQLIADPTFKTWFRNSRVVRKYGEETLPLVLYHATSSDFETFMLGDLGFHFGDYKAAQDRLISKRVGVEKKVEAFPTGYALPGESIMPVFLRIENPLRMPDVGPWQSFPVVLRNIPLDVYKQFSDEYIDRMFDIRERLERMPTRSPLGEILPELEHAYIRESREGLAVLRDALMSIGYDGIVYTNAVENKGSTSYIAFKPEQIKSIFNRGTWSDEYGSVLASIGMPTDIGIQDNFDAITNYLGEAAYNLAKVPVVFQKALAAAGLDKYPDVLKRTELLLRPIVTVPLNDLSPDSVRSWSERFKITEEEVLLLLDTGMLRIEGLTTIRSPLAAAIQLSKDMHRGYEDLRDTAFHEMWHLIERWILPPDVLAKMVKFESDQEVRADKFKEFAKTNYTENAKKHPSFVQEWWERIKNFLWHLRHYLIQAEIKSSEDVFRLVGRGAFTPHFGNSPTHSSKTGITLLKDTLAALVEVREGQANTVSEAATKSFEPDTDLNGKSRVRNLVGSWMQLAPPPSGLGGPQQREGYQGQHGPRMQDPRLLEMPELVDLVRMLSEGRIPAIRKLLFGDHAKRGVFMPGSGNIRLKADIFKDAFLAAKTLGHEIGHLVDWLPDKYLRGNILGKIAGLRSELPKVLPFEPGAPGALTEADKQRLREEAIKLLGTVGEVRTKIVNEIVGTENVKADDILAIWNAVEQAKLLTPELYRYIAGLDTNAKKLIVKSALKGIVESELQQFAKTITEQREVTETIMKQPTQAEIAKKLAELINEELKKRKLFVEEEVRDELKDLSRVWRPFDPELDPKHTQYRWSSTELYADALSVLLNDPRWLRQQAPRFYEAFFNYLDTNPKVRDAYMEIQRRLHSGEVDRIRAENTFAMFDKGNAAIGQQFEQYQYTRDHLFRDFIDSYHFITKDIKRVGEGQIPVHDNPRYLLEQMVYTGSEIEAFLTDLYVNVLKPLRQNNLGWDREFGMFIMLNRIATERAAMANPLGWTPQLAAQKIEAMKNELSSEQWNGLITAAKNFRALHEEYFINKAEAASVYDDSMIKLFRDNEAYARFDVLPYLEKRFGRPVAMRIHSQIGTLQEISNPATATIMNDIAFIKAVNKNTAARAVVKFYKDYANVLGIEIVEAKKRWNGRFHEIQEPKAGSRKGLIVYLHKGKAYGYYVQKEIADAVNANHMEALGVARIFRALTSPFRKVFTEYNYGFWLFNVHRDFKRMTVALPGYNVAKFAKHWLKGLKPAMKSVLAIPDPVVREMQKKNMLISVADFQGHTTEDFQVDKLLRVYDMMGPQKFETKIKGPFGHLINWVINSPRLYKAAHYYAAVGKALERTTKVGAYTYLKEKFPQMPDEVIGHIVRVRGGSPDFLRAGREQQLYNNIIMFSNAMKEGYVGDWEAFQERPGEFMIKRFTWMMIPKILMFAGLYGLLGEPIKRIMDGISEYDLTNYLIIPLGLTSTGKSVYWRFPLDETGRWLGGVFWKMLRAPELGLGSEALSIFDYTAGQLPSVTPMVNLIPDIIDYVGGRNPFDNFYGRYAVPPLTFQARDWRSHQTFLKYLAQNMGANVAYKFKHDQVERVAQELEEVLGFPIHSKIADFTLEAVDLPVVHNTLGRFLKVSDYGLREKVLKKKDEIRRKNARVLLDAREAAYSLVNNEELGDKQLLALAMKPDVVSNQMMLALARKYGMVYFEEWLSAGSTEEKFAVLGIMMEKNALSFQDMVRELPEEEKKQVEEQFPGLSVQEKLTKEK